MDELLLLSRTNKDFSNSAALCFTETWLNDAIPDSVLHLPNFQLIRADRNAESTCGTCFYINKRWCTDVTVLKKMCCSDLEMLFINCKPFYSPREICSFILVSVYIPPQAHVSSAVQKLADQITDTEQKHPDSVLIILGDFNKANLSRELPKYRQHITCPTRDSNILDHCYTTIKEAYHSVPRAALGLSDHCLVHLIPTYRQKLKSAKPVLRTVKRLTNEAEQDLKAWLDLKLIGLDCFRSCCKRSGRAHRDCNIIYQFLWGYVHSYQDSFNLQQRQTMVHCKTQTAPSGQRRCLQKGG